MSVLNDKSLEELLKTNSKKLIFTNGCFDILHVGHLRYLEASKAIDPEALLIVGLNSDSSVKALKGPSRPINNEDNRAELLNALKPVDHVVIFSESTAERLLKAVNADYYTKGGDYDLSDFNKCPEFKVASEISCEVRLINFEEGYSSTKSISEMELSQ